MAERLLPWCAWFLVKEATMWQAGNRVRPPFLPAQRAYGLFGTCGRTSLTTRRADSRASVASLLR